MAKRVVWTDRAKKSRKDILEYWAERTGSKNYPKKLSRLFREKTRLLSVEHYVGRQTNFKDVRVSLVEHFSVFYKINEKEITIVGIWDNRRNPDDLKKNIG
ncbi:MAG TPA: type II toxin-antitoxin system RelE/ParE family toxin [Flavipsychrobacter sp.]|nr:type II toxin-antitoxin system RelE/ParE family toxin [Flavipsychrobacter sp.]